MTALSFGCFTITLHNSARTDVRLTGLFWAGYSFLPFLKTGTMFASFQVTRISTDCQGYWKIIERCPTVTSVSSLSTLGWIPLCPRPIYIQLEPQILHKFRAGWESTVTAFTVLQLRDSKVPQPVTSVEDTSLLCLCPCLWGDHLHKEQTRVTTSGPSFTLDMPTIRLEKTELWITLVF